MRIDKWLWVARFFKTRSLATQAVDGGKVLWQGVSCKPAREIRAGDRLNIRIGEMEWEILVHGISDQRGPATVAQSLYAETPESRAKREAVTALRKMRVEPARDIKGRPTKRDRRILGAWKGE